MITVPGFRISQQIYESSNTLVLRAFHEKSRRAVVLKILKGDRPAPEEIRRYQHEYDITRSLDLKGVPRTYGIEKYNGKLIITLEDIGAHSLDLLNSDKMFTAEEFLIIGIQIAGFLGAIHSCNIIHKNINPSNIIFNPDSGQLQIIDFGIATVLPREEPLIRNPEVLEGTLPFISPEQTGRMNRCIDYRTDFYSLGVTFYKLLTQKLPFESRDPMELVHYHLARQPVPPHKVTQTIPKAISHIIMKLMAKTAGQRYQSAWGLQADLQICQNQLRTSGKITEFQLGKLDVSANLPLSQTLYGREPETDALLAAFERVCLRRKELTLISGYAGIGKTALVQEIYKPLTKHRGYFISGKYDQLKRNIPYSAIICAFKELVRQLLSESEARLARWRNMLIKALGPNGQVITDVIPEVELIVGPQPPVAVLDPAEAQNRFNFVFQNFIRTFAAPDQPLVLFLDDLQWIDSASLKLIKLITTAPDIRPLFFIGAFRDNEVQPTHPLMRTIDEISETGFDVDRIELSPLDLSQVNRFLADTLHCTRQKSQPLAELVLDKTNGNPYFMKEFVKSIYSENFLFFDPKDLTWQWCLADIQKRVITDNVVELIASRIQKLAGEVQSLLQVAACIGNQFDLNTLSLVVEKPLKETAENLSEAATAGLVFPVGDAYKSVKHDELRGRVATYRFAHDRVQQTAYSKIPQENRTSFHRRIGQIFLKNKPATEQEERIFDIVDQLNLGIELVTSETDRYELAGLNLAAGRKAKAAAAFEPAWRYFKIGIDLLFPQLPSAAAENESLHSSWQTNYELTLALYLEAAEAAYLSTAFEEMERLVAIVEKNARTTLDKVKVYEIKIQAAYAHNHLQEAVMTALEVLRLLGVSFPAKPDKRHAIFSFFCTKPLLLGKRIEHLIDLPEMTDPEKLAAMRIMTSAVLASFYAAPELFPLIVFKGLRFSLKYGNTAESIFAYAGYGLILCGVIGDLESGYQFGHLALNLLQRLNAREFSSKTIITVNTFIRHWKEHIRASLDPLKDAYQSGMETGDLEFAATSAHVYVCLLYYCGKELAEVDREAAVYSEAIWRLKQTTALNYHHIVWQAVQNLLGKNENPRQLSGLCYDEVQMLPQHLEANDRNAVFMSLMQIMVLNYLFRDFDQALKCTFQAEKYLDAVVGSPDVPLYYFYDSLIQLTVLPGSRKADRKKALARVSANQKKMNKWADSAPMNYRHKFHLVEAERLRAQNKPGIAAGHYEKAIRTARQYRYLNEEALANELAARFYLTLKKMDEARHYMTDARSCYRRWGAQTKVQDLDAQVLELFGDTTVESEPASKSVLKNDKITVTHSGEELDLISAVKASQTISGEIKMGRLLKKLMQIVIENAGAQTGCLILKSEGGLLIQAEKTIEAGQIQVLQARPAVKAKILSTAILNYVQRTLKPVVIDDAASDDRFLNDPAIHARQPKSVLCQPLLFQSSLIGMLYLENNLSTGAFTPKRLDILELLGAQIVISLENAQLYRDLENQAEKLKQINLNLNREITRRRKAEDELRTHQGYLENVVEQRTSQLKASRQAFARLQQEGQARRHYRNIVGQSAKMQEVYSLIEELADAPVTVLITGESGTGKELVAGALHDAGLRRTKPFIKVNCAALSETILESELFGHVRGAFTGAVQNKVGRFQKAADGTILLDEIGDISPYFQKRLLRVLQEKEFEQVGDTRPIKMNARVLATTNQDLLSKVRQGAFREDLYYRLRVVELQLPQLGARIEDIPLLVQHFLIRFKDELNQKASDVTPEALNLLKAYPWPGNVRELEHVLQHTCIMCKNPVIRATDLPPEFRDPSRQKTASARNSADELQALRRALESVKWNKTKAARLLGISRRTLYRKLNKYNLIQ